MSSNFCDVHLYPFLMGTKMGINIDQLTPLTTIIHVQNLSHHWCCSCETKKKIDFLVIAS